MVGSGTIFHFLLSYKINSSFGSEFVSFKIILIYIEVNSFDCDLENYEDMEL
jgi:hypothetical protein